MKHPKLIPIFLCLIGAGGLSAQEVVSSSGNHHENASLMISYTLGETVINTGSTSENTLTQGFHQSKLTVAGIDAPLNLEVNVFPNPTTDQVTVEFTGTHSIDQVQLYDGAGRLIEQRALRAGERRISFDLSSYATGNYILHLQDKTAGANTYQIIKTHQP